MSKLEIHQFPCLEDNYGVLVHDPESGETASIDVPDARAVTAGLDLMGWKLTHILVTHHHWDHTQGVGEIKNLTGCKVIGPSAEAEKIANLDETVSDGDTFFFGNESVEVISTPGHTLGMVNFYFPQSAVVFTGDTLFALGCGRVFEGTMAMMWNSLQKLAKLPSETLVYCGHEYTESNAKFSLSVDPDNEKLVKRAAEISELRAKGMPTLPTSIGSELETNPFLRPDDASIRKHLGMENASNSEVFAEIRTRKDNA